MRKPGRERHPRISLTCRVYVTKQNRLVNTENWGLPQESGVERRADRWRGLRGYELSVIK